MPPWAQAAAAVCDSVTGNKGRVDLETPGLCAHEKELVHTNSKGGNVYV